jgi:zinc transporter, ZIP family
MILIKIILIGFFTAWSGLIIGSVISIILTKKSNQFNLLLTILSGFILTFIFLDLIPESLELGDYFLSILGIILGVLISILIDRILSHDNHNQLNSSLLLISISIALHNITAGVVLGMILFSSLSIGIHLTIIFMLHGIPEGLIIGFFTQNRKNILINLIIITILISLPMAFGAFLGFLLGNLSPMLSTKSLALTSGILMYTLFKELIPISLKENKPQTFSFLIIIGIILGIVNISIMH